MQYQNVVGQDKIKTYLREAVRKQTLPHALLFLGDAGFGPLPMALATAQYLMCLDRTEQDACGVCTNCHKAAKWIHPDIHFSFPTIGSKVTSLDLIKDWRSFLSNRPYGSIEDWLAQIGGENKQGNINKDECHRILKALSLKTFEGDYKIHLLWMAEYLGKEGNRLLKIIEEPPEKTVFILMASDQDAILNTILSRCQLVTFSALSDGEVHDHLAKTSPNLAKKDLQQIAYLADGNIGKAEVYLVDSANLLTGLWLEWMRTTFKGNPVEMVKWTDKFARVDREGQKRFLSYGLHFLREMLQYKVNSDRAIRLLEKEKSALVKLSVLISLNRLESMLQLLEESIFHLERNANGRIVMLDNSIQMSRLLKAEHQMTTT